MIRAVHIAWLCAFFAGHNAWTQNVYDSTAVKYAEMMDIGEVKRHLSVLTSDSLEGRETATVGQRRAARYLADELGALGLKTTNTDGSYIQRYPLVEIGQGPTWLRMEQDTLKLYEDFYTFTFARDTILSFTEVKFLGYGISDEKYDNYKDVNVKGKAVVIMNGEPQIDNKYLISQSLMPTLWSDGYDAKIELASHKGASCIFVVQESYHRNLPRATRYLKRARMRLSLPQSDQIPVIFIAPEQLDNFFGAGSKETLLAEAELGKDRFKAATKAAFELKISKNVRRLWADNVLGYLEGSEKQDEYVFVTAHYDHLGRDGDDIYYGADDNGSGTSTLLEMARLFKLASEEGFAPRRNVVFLFFSGEEKGLLGSEWYTDNPLIPLEQTVTALNVDMIGRKDANFDADHPPYIYVIGSDKLSAELHALSEHVNDLYSGLVLDYKYNDPNDPQRLYYRSDHYNFAKHNIPIIFYFKGLHEDYHKPTDTMQKLRYQDMLETGRFIFHTTWELANRPHRVKVDEVIR